MLLSAIPVTLDYGYDNNISVGSGVVHTFDGLYYSNSSLLASAKDVTLNKSELLILTDNIKLSDTLTPVFAPTPEQYVYSTLIANYQGNYLYATDLTSTEGSPISTTTDITQATVFNFYFPASANTIQIFYNVKQSDGTEQPFHLVTPLNGTNLLSSADVGDGGGAFNDPSYYTYYYILSGSSISLITVNPSFPTQWLDSSLTFSTLSAATYNDLTVPASKIFYATRLVNANLYNALQTYGQSDLVKYTKINNTLDVNNSSGNSSFNYLISAPFKTLSDESLSVNINLLKNYYSPLHDQSAVLSSPLRSYNKIYTGLNETEGYDKVYLGYNASTSKIILEKNNDTYFHYPYGTNVLYLSASTLVDYGAYADITPYRSDKIFKKVANYKKYSNWGTSTNNPQKGTYFCSWLSAGTTSTGSLDVSARPVWVDRYYDPAHINIAGIPFSSIVSLSGIITDSINNYPNLIWDTPSSLTFEPGVVYYYHRIGENDNTTIVSGFSGLQYHFNEWAPDLVNAVTSLTAGKIISYTSGTSAIDATVKEPYYVIGNTYGYIDTNEQDFDNNKGNTLSFFAFEDNWSEIKADQILGNYSNGGLGIFNSNPILTPLFTINAYSSAGSTVRTFNSSLDLLNYETYTTHSSDVSVPSFALKSNYDESYYIVDNNAAKYVAGFDPDDLITKKTSSVLASGTTLIADTFLHRDAVTGVYYLVAKTHPTVNSVTYTKMTTSGELVTSYTSVYNNFTLDLSGNPTYYNSNIPNATLPVSGYDMWSGTNGCVNSSNDVYALSGNGTASTTASVHVLLKDGTEIAQVTSPEYVNCDQDDNIWVTYNSKYLAKLDRDGKVIWNNQINTSESIVAASSTRVVNFLAENTANGVVYYGLVIDGKSQYIYKIDTNGNVVKKVAVNGLRPGGDSTGFDFQRKYIKPYTNTPSIKAKLVVKDSTLSDPVPVYITLSYSVSGLAGGWHHFALTYDQTNSAKLYVDGNLVSQNTTLTPPTTAAVTKYRVYNYKNNPQISIGTSNFKNGTLNTWINQPTTYLFNGKVADIRLYNITLNNSDIRAISKNYEYEQFNNLSWVIPTGTRGYIEEIERFFLHRMPGSKSQFYNVKIKNSGITDPYIRSIVENNIRNATTNVAPAYTKLRSIVWE